MRLRKRWHLLFYFVAIYTFAQVFLSIIPTVPYRPYCGGIRNPIYFDGPLRPEYRDMLEQLLVAQNFYYWKIGDRIILRRYATFDGNELFDGRYDLFSNFEWKMIRNLAEGYLASGELAPPPQPLMNAIRATEDKYGMYRPDYYADNIARFSDCAVKRAGTILTEKLDVASDLGKIE